MKFKTSIFLALILCISCKAQKTIDSEKLSTEHYQVLEAFINQEFNYRDRLYLNKNISQKRYSKSFNENYKQLQITYKNADSICNYSLDTFAQRTNCRKAYFLKKYNGLFTEIDLNYFEASYSNVLVKNFVIDIEMIQNIIPSISNHSESYYIDENLNFKETPSLKIQGIYFSKNKKYALIAHTIFPWSMRNGLRYGILKKEKKLWWRLIGSIRVYELPQSKNMRY